MYWLRKLMMGRYGGDQFSIALIIVSMVFTFLGEAFQVSILTFIGYIPLGFGVYRMLSKDVNRRRMENYKFAMFMSPVYAWYRKTFKRLADSKTHKFFKCPSCKAELRVPKGKGKILVTCPKCRMEFMGKT